MSDDLIERLLRRAKRDDGSLDPLLLEASGYILALERGIAHLRERDKLKSSADKYHEEVLVLRARLKTAEADALERAARVLSRASEEIRALKPKASE